MAAETERLAAEIRDTRDRLSHTLDELGDRLNPGHIKQSIKANIREATVGRVENMARHATDRVQDTREGIMDTIRDNPVPVAMIGIGLGWMLLNGRRRPGYDIGYDTARGAASPEYYGDIGARTPRLAQDDAAGGLGASVAREPGVVAKTQEKLSDVKDTAQEIVSDVAHRVQDAAQGAAVGTRYQAYRVEDRVQYTLQDNPLAVGAVALALGMAAGFAIPESQRERQVMGPARDKLVDRARDVVQDARTEAEQAARYALDETELDTSEDVRLL